MTKFLWGRLKGIAPATFWPWGHRPHRPHGVGVYVAHLIPSHPFSFFSFLSEERGGPGMARKGRGGKEECFLEPHTAGIIGCVFQRCGLHALEAFNAADVLFTSVVYIRRVTSPPRNLRRRNARGRRRIITAQKRLAPNRWRRDGSADIYRSDHK